MTTANDRSNSSTARLTSASASRVPVARGFLTLSNKGHDFRLLQDFMGHRDPRHTSRYTRTASRRFEGLWK